MGVTTHYGLREVGIGRGFQRSSSSWRYCITVCRTLCLASWSAVQLFEAEPLCDLCRYVFVFS